MRTPETIAGIERAIILLGNRSKGAELGKRPKQELIGLVGTYPSPSEALAHKSKLKKKLKTIKENNGNYLQDQH